MDIQSELKSSKEIIVYLAKQFPNCFTIDGDAKPLKIGIFQDLVERLAANGESFSKTKLRVALRSYTASWRYLYSIKDGANRVDLDGNLCEIITAEQAEYAKTQLKESKEKAKTKRLAENKDKPVDSDTPKVKRKSVSKPNLSKSKPENKKSTSLSQPILRKVDINELKIGDSIKVILGTKPVSATISSIGKDHIKVKIASGMELSVTAEHILI